MLKIKAPKVVNEKVSVQFVYQINNDEEDK